MTTEDKLLKLRKLADAMYYAAKSLTTDASRMHKAMEDYHQFIVNEYHKEEPTIHDIVDEHFYEMLGEEPINNGLDLGCGVIWKDEEPVSEDLASFAIKYAQDKPYPVAVCQAVKAGANWQAEQFEKNRLKHCNSITNEQAELESDFIDQHLDKHQRIPTYLDAIEYGRNLQKEQIMKKAFPVEIGRQRSDYKCVLHGNFSNYDTGDKVKVIVIKED